jgi:pimeloyl-ACP methyl ester carboxylesterase
MRKSAAARSPRDLERPLHGARRRAFIAAMLAFYPLCFAFVLGCAAEVASDGASDAELGHASAALSETSLAFEVKLRGQSPVQIHARVWSGGARGGATVLAVHGLAETGAIYGPLANAILEDRQLRRRVRQVIAIDMPGHGESGVPAAASGLRFGDLTIEDNVGVVLDSIRALRGQGLAPSVLVGHSMGGLEVQAAQETLLAQGSSLARLGIRRALLLAPVPPHGQPWTQPPASDISALIVNDPELGTYLNFPPQVVMAQMFGKLDGTLASNAPSVQEVIDAGYVGNEPLGLLLQLVEAPVQLPDGSMVTLARPSVREGAFRLRNGTALELASFSQDPLVPAADLALLYPYLTGDRRNRLYTPIVGDDATHAMFIPDAEGVLDALRTL